MPDHFDAQQAATARWMGYPDAAAMNRDHDPLHEALCRWLGIPSHAMLAARGEAHDGALAAMEEDAVLHLQRFMVNAGAGVPGA